MGKLTVKEELSTPQTPSSGYRTIYPKADGWYEKSDLGVEKKVFSENVYGSNYIGISISGVDTNTLETFKTYLGLQYPAGIAQVGHKYEITFTALVGYSNVKRNVIGRVALDGTTLEEEISIELTDSGTDIRMPMGYKYVIDGGSLNVNGGFVDFDFRSQLLGDTSRVYSCTLTFKRVS